MNPKGGEPHHDLDLTLCEAKNTVGLNPWSPASLLLNPFSCNACKDICTQLHSLLSFPPQSCSKDWRCLSIILKELVWSTVANLLPFFFIHFKLESLLIAERDIFRDHRGSKHLYVWGLLSDLTAIKAFHFCLDWLTMMSYFKFKPEGISQGKLYTVYAAQDGSLPG